MIEFRPRRSDGASDRRGTYFEFQGLLAAVLLLLFLYHKPGAEDWVGRFFFLTAVLGASLVALQLVAEATLSLWWAQAGLFVGDAVITSLTLFWTQPRSDLYLLYLLIIFGTALTRSVVLSVCIGGVTSLLYFTAHYPWRGLQSEPGFWLRMLLLWITSVLLAILARDSRQVERDQERRFQERHVQVERLATLGRIAGEVAHRIKAPLTTILVNAEVLAHRAAGSREILRELEQIRDEVGHCKEILRDLLDLGRIEEMDLAPLDLREPIRSAVGSIQAQARDCGVAVSAEGLSKPLPVRGDQSLLHEAIAAVLQNSLEATRRGGSIRLSVRSAARPWWRRTGAPDVFLIEVADDGAGIRAEDLERIFQPFFTTKGSQGTGLGLSAALRIMEKHGGTIAADSDGLGRGALVTLSIPKASRARRK